MRRIAMTLAALAAAALLALAGCRPAGPRPEGRPAATGSRTAWPARAGGAPACPEPSLARPPALLDIIAYGLEGDLWWSPGRAWKVNWEMEHPATPESRHRPFTLRLTPAGAAEPAYTLTLPPGPSLVHFPGPGCWDLTLERDHRTATVRLSVQADSPAALHRPGPGGSGAALPAAAQDIRTLLRALTQGGERPVPAGRPAVPLELRWQSGLADPLFFVPGGPDGPPLLVAPRALRTGDCRDRDPVAVPLPRSLAGRLAGALGGADPVPLRLPDLAPCAAFAPAP